MSEQIPSSVAALVRDLLFASKITATAKSLGLAIQMLRDPVQLAACDAKTLIVDLNQAGALEAAAEWRSRTAGVVIGFVSHLDTATIAQAHQLGIDQVLARGAFTQLLPQLLSNDHPPP